MYASPKRSALISGLLHAAAIVLVLLATAVKIPPRDSLTAVPIAGRDISAYVPIVPTKGGGGGGARDDMPATKGPLPPTRLHPFTPPVVRILNENPRLAMEAAILGPPDLTVPAPAYGDPDGILGRLSSGPGDGGGIGDGHKGGVGGGRGPGAGKDGEGGISSGAASVRGVVTAPVLLWKNEPEYTEEARKAKLQGTIMLRIEIDARGQARNIDVVHSLGLGLDERAVESVRRWRFRPGYSGGTPVVTSAIVEVSFRLL